MKKDYSLDFAKVTEGAALAAYKWLGRGDKNAADQAAVSVMRTLLNQNEIKAQIVIGEGEIDDAPMLYIGEELGLGGEEIEIAVDPIEGTRMTAMGQSNAITVLAAGEKGCFLKAPDMYMEKLVVGPKAKDAINLNLPLEENIKNIAKALNKSLDQLTVITLAKPRHDQAIIQMQAMGVRVFAIPDGDVAASILTCMPESSVDMMYCIGGAPEGVISGAVIRALGGNMNAKLLPRHQVKEDNEENQIIGADEMKRCQEMGVQTNQVLKLEQMVRSHNLIFAATGITQGDLLEGIICQEEMATTETLVIHGQSGTIRRIKSSYNLSTLSS